jgi:hypothetical protein
MQITPTRCRKLTCIRVANLPYQDNKICFVVTFNAEFRQICTNIITIMTKEIPNYLLHSLLSLIIKEMTLCYCLYLSTHRQQFLFLILVLEIGVQSLCNTQHFVKWDKYMTYAVPSHSSFVQKQNGFNLPFLV